MKAEPRAAGVKAPEFTLPGDPGDPVTLSALAPAPVVLFFYPRDNTPGCTAEALDFSARSADFTGLETRVFGISADSLQKHRNFRARHGLTVPLLSDSDGKVCRAYGVWGDKQNFGRTYQGITRTTFLIGADGVIARVWKDVRVAGHADAVLAAVRAL